jgi:L-ascorbate metabolism protein UlaG (beta-lactamase superfamily)
MSGSIRFLGHAPVDFITSENKVILFDPWTRDDGNPACPIGMEEIERADLVMVSHDHFDHIGLPLRHLTLDIVC